MWMWTLSSKPLKYNKEKKNSPLESQSPGPKDTKADLGDVIYGRLFLTILHGLDIINHVSLNRIEYQGLHLRKLLCRYIRGPEAKL